MKSAAHDFPSRARAALRNLDLARAMARARTGFIDKRRAAVDALPEYPRLRRIAYPALQQMEQAPPYPDAGPFAPASAEP